MAGKGPSGATLPSLAVPTVLPTSHEKCPKSPGKRKYYNLNDAETAAAFSAQQYGKPMRAYVCDGCGLYHVTGKVTYGDVVSSSDDGVIVTAGMSTRPAWKKFPGPNTPERVDMSEIIAMESPIVAGNPAAREKLLAEYLEGKETTTSVDVQEYLQVSREAANNALNALGWQGARGRKEWYPPGADAPAAKPASLARMDRKRTRKPKTRLTGEALVKARLKVLRPYLAEHDGVTTSELKELLDGAGHDQIRELMLRVGWVAGHGKGAQWTRGEEAAPQEVRPAEASRPRALHALDKPEEGLLDRELDSAMDRHPAHSPEPEPVQPAAPAWRDVPNLDALRGKFIGDMVEELAPYGLEIRIQIREKR